MSADDIILVMRSGRIVKTAGLPQNLGGTTSLTPDPLDNLVNATTERTYIRSVDFAETHRFGVEVHSEFQTVGPETITITEIEFDTVHIAEHCSARTLNWRFTNHYWLDPADGFVWRSTQTVLPNLPDFAIETLKPSA